MSAAGAKEIKVLWLEDDVIGFPILRKNLRQCMEPLVQLDVDHVEQPLEACDKLLGHADNYHLFVADLLFRETPDDKESPLVPDGLLAVREARKHSHLAILAITVAQDLHPGIRDQFEESGGHDYIDKNDIRYQKLPQHKLRDRLVRLLRSKGHLIQPAGSLGGKLEWEPKQERTSKDLRLDAVIETVGRETLENLLSQAHPDCSRFRPFYVAPGYSGAVVLRMQGYVDDSSSASAELLVKCSRDEGKIRDEVDRSPEADEPSAIIYVPCKTRAVFEWNGWFSSFWRFREDACTFLTWLSSPRATPDATARLLSAVFPSGLALDYERGTSISTDPVAILLPNLQSRARIIQSAEFLRTLAELVPGIGTLEMKDIQRLILKSAVGARGKAKLGKHSFECISHGDLHCRNILVAKDSGQPLLIDPARRGRRHWGSDPARLCADLWVSAWDAGTQCHLWDRLVDWREAVHRWLTGDDMKDCIPGENRPVAVALAWIRDNLGEVFRKAFGDALPMSEFHLALAAEFLEFLDTSVYPDASTPKRCLALLSAHDLLCQIETQGTGTQA